MASTYGAVISMMRETYEEYKRMIVLKTLLDKFLKNKGYVIAGNPYPVVLYRIPDEGRAMERLFEGEEYECYIKALELLSRG